MAKYIIAECTPDISRKEQLSLTIWFVGISGDNDSGPLMVLLAWVYQKFSFRQQLSMNSSLVTVDVRPTAMGRIWRGKNNDVQKRILDVSPLSVYFPCGSHSLNVVPCDFAESSVESSALFGILQRSLDWFSVSVNRWKILTDHAETYDLEKLSDTRWEAKIKNFNNSSEDIRKPGAFYIA